MAFKLSMKSGEQQDQQSRGAGGFSLSMQSGGWKDQQSRDTGGFSLSMQNAERKDQQSKSTGTFQLSMSTSKRVTPSFTDIPTAQTSLTEQQAALSGLTEKVKTSRASMDELEGRMKRFKDSATHYQTDSRLGIDPVVTAAYDRSVQQYHDLLPSYKRAVQDYNALVQQYNAARDQYNTDFGAYHEILGSQRDTAKEYISRAEALEEEAKQLSGQAAFSRREGSGRRSRVESGTQNQEIRKAQAAAEEKRKEAAQLREKAATAEGYYYSSIPLAEDFAEKSKAAGSKINLLAENGGDAKYDFINDINGIRDKVKEAGQDGEYTRYSYLEDDETGIYNYLYATQGKEAAESFLDKLANTLNYRRGTETYENMNGLQKSLYWIPQGLDQFATGIGQLFSKDALPTSPTQYAGSMIQREAAEIGAQRDESGQVQYDENGKIVGQSLLGKVASGAYGLGTTVSNMAPSILVSYLTGGLTGGAAASGTMSAATAGQLAGAAGTVAMGASAAGNAYKMKLDEGWTPDQARSYAALVGLSESTLQHVLGGISALGGGSSLGDKALTKILGQVAKVDNALAKTALNFGARLAVRGLGEGIEEGLQEVLEPAFATLITGQDYEVDAGDVAYAFIMGYLASNVFEAPGAFRGAIAPTALDTVHFNRAGLDSYLGTNGVDYFDGCRSAEDVKTRYRELARKNHPDTGGDGAVMAEINRQRGIQDAFYRGTQKAAETAQRARESETFTDAVRKQLAWQSETAQESVPERLSLPTPEETGSKMGPFLDDWPEGFAEVVRQQLIEGMLEDISQPEAGFYNSPIGLSLPTLNEAGSKTDSILDDWPEGFAEAIRQQLMGEIPENISQLEINPGIRPIGLSLPTLGNIRDDMTYDQWKSKQDELHGAESVDQEGEKSYNHSRDEADYKLYKDMLGKNAPKSFAEYQKLRYSTDWTAFKAYARAIESGELTALADFELFQSTSTEIDRVLVGITTSNGLQITGKSYHYIARTIGSVEQRRNGVQISDVLLALTKPIKIDPVVVNANGRSQRFKGRNCYVTINPDTCVLIQVNPHTGGK